MNNYDLACKQNVLAKEFDKQLHEVFKMIDNHATEKAIDYEINELEKLYSAVEVNEGINGFFKHYAKNLTASIRTYKDSDADVMLDDLDSEDLIYISSKIDEIIKDTM